MKTINLLFTVALLISGDAFTQPGNIDLTFSGDGIQTTAISGGGNRNDYDVAVALQPNGKIVVGGWSDNGTIPCCNYDFAIVRYNDDGTLDNTFNGNGIKTTNILNNNLCKSVVLQPDGRILAAGTSTTTYGEISLVRYNTDGTPDNSFSSDGKLTTVIGNRDQGGNSVAVQTDGKIIIAASYSNYGTGWEYDFAVVRYNSDGSLDSTFSNDGIQTTSIGTIGNSNGEESRAVAIQPDGKIVITGSYNNGTNDDFAIVRYNSDGTLDTTFGNGGIQTAAIGSGNDIAHAIAIQPDGKIIIGGSSFNGTNTDFALVRYNIDGMLDTTFSGDGILTTPVGGNDAIYSIKLQNNGRIVVAGSDGSGVIYIARYFSDGNLDTAFSSDGIQTAAIGYLQCGLSLQSNGKIVVAGSAWNSITLDYDFGVARYYGDATQPSINLDSGLVAHYPFNGNANDESGNGNNGTVNGATLTTDRFGIANKAYNFNGTSNNIDLGSGNTLNLSDSITISLWINIQNYQSSPVIINRRVSSPSLHDQYGLSMVNGKVYWAMQYATSANSFLINASQDVTLNGWHHFVGTFDGTNALLFVDDSMVASTTVSTIPTGGFGNTVVGSLITSGQYYFAGMIDDIRIYGRGLSSVEIDSLYHQGGWPVTSPVNLDSGLVAHYPFNGNANDESGNNYNGTVNGATLSTDRFGNANTAYVFNGSSDYILVDTIPPVNFGTGNFTISTWIKANTTQLTYPMVLSTRGVSLDGFLHGLFSTGRFFYQDVSNTFISSGNDLRDNVWHHLITVRDNNVLTLFVDGVNTASGSSTNNITSPDKLYIGWDIGNPTVTYFNGLIDDIRIYNRALNTAEIQTLYNDTSSQPPPPTCTASNVVVNKPAYASSTLSPYTPDKAFDGDSLNTWWWTNGGTPQWIMVNLQKQFSVDSIYLHWRVNNNYTNVVYTSADSVSWTAADSFITGIQSSHYLRFNPPLNNVKYVKVETTSGGSPCAWYEILVFACDTAPTQNYFVNAYFSSATVCFGASTQFTELSSGNDTITSWQWNFGDPPSGGNNTSALQNPSHLFSSSGVFNVTLIASGNNASDTIVKQVVVNTLPQVNAGTDKTICTGSGVYLYATGGNSYQWAPSAGLNCTNCQQPYASPVDTTNYIVTVTNSNQCSAQDTVVVNVAPIPSPSITPPGDTICQGNSTTLDAGAGYSAYSWNSGQNTQTATVSQPGWYYVWVTNSAGCWGQSPSVYVGIKSNVTFTVSPSSTVCEGETISLSASAGFLTYQWSDGSTGQNITVTSSGIYDVTATDGSNCSMVSSPVSLTVKDTNITPQVYIYGDTSFCDGGYVWLEAQTGFDAYQWSNGEITRWNYITASGTYSVTATDMCGSYASQSITVTEYPLPNPILNVSGSTALCQGQNVSLTAPNGYSYYYWQQTGTSLPSILVSSAGNYFCRVQDVNGCWGTSDTVAVTVGPDVFISPSGYASICDGNNLSITANGTNIVSYQWSSGETTPVINATVAGIYNVTVTDNNSCTGTAPYPLNLSILDTNPIPIIYLAYNDSVLCQGEYVYLYTDCNYQQYQWSNNANTCGQYVNQGGGYSVTVNNGCGTGISSPVNISVNALPTVSAGSDVTICGGQNTTLGVSGGVSWQWYPSYGLTCANCQSPVASPAYTTTYYVYGTDAAGCQGSDDVTVFVEPSNVSFSANPTVQYLPDNPGTIYFTYTGSTTNITAYLWDFGDGNQSTTVNPAHTYSTKGWYDISLTVTNNGGCSTTITYNDYILIEQVFPAVTLNTGTVNNINGVSFVTGYYGWAAMNDGNVLITNDGGTTWAAGYVNAGVPLWGIYLFGNAGYVVGDNGFISISYDGGGTWSNFVTGISAALYNVYLSALNYGFAVGANGTILQYDGSVWTPINLGINVNLNAVYTYGLFTYIVGDGGLMLKYDGFSWDTLVTNITVDLNSIYFVNNLLGYAAGAGGTIIMTSDGGATWAIVCSGLASSFKSIAPLTADSVVAVGTDGIVYLSTDAGLSWGRYSIGDNRALYGLSVISDGWGGVTGYIAGAAGGVFKFEKTVVTAAGENREDSENNFAIKIYPNPAEGIINVSNFRFQTSNCTIYDVMGREVMNITLNRYAASIDCSGLDAGVYIIRATAGEEIAFGKFIVAK